MDMVGGGDALAATGKEDHWTRYPESPALRRACCVDCTDLSPAYSTRVMLSETDKLGLLANPAKPILMKVFYGARMGEVELVQVLRRLPRVVGHTV